ncbi:hypothetical protein BFW87_00415 [Pseudomonas fluorescens]|uniref:Major facilitator superfamily (MFS) profile domain-containing protein n=1 Tax=Pseudomonas fluorescens TaxID=294 RepID=A0A1T2Z8E8_PSEFL|nr:MFS transporter [Pseudomonas fluorescens]OPB00911.1 hypothetical protein BFW87_00415 [Pseudomonas fluorescens]
MDKILGTSETVVRNEYSAETDPREILRTAPMSRNQIYGIIITGLLSALDGYDLLATAFVAPALAAQFGVGPGGLGILLSSGLAGTLFGAFLLAPLADSVGRKPIVLISLLILILGMAASAVCDSLTQLAIVRLFTGIGIGAMMVIVNPISAELSNARNRAFVIAIKAIGFPIGGAIAGGLAALLVAPLGWQSIFIIGAVSGIALVPLVIWKLPESISYLYERRPAGALHKINVVLRQFGHKPLKELPAAPSNSSVPYLAIFDARHFVGTLSASLFCLLSWIAIFFFLSWQTKMLVDAGLSMAQAAAISGTSSLSGAAGVLFFAFAARRFNERLLSVASVFGLGIAIIAFGLMPASVWALGATAIVVGGFITGATVALYVVTTGVFEARMLATGSGFVIGIGRIGSAIAPWLAGVLFTLELERASVTAIMGAFAIAAGLIMWFMPRLKSEASAVKL